MGACELGVLSLALDLVTAWSGTQLSLGLRYSPTLLMVFTPHPHLWFSLDHSSQRGLASDIEVCTAREVGVHGVPLYPGAAHSPRLLATRHPFLRIMLCPGASQVTPIDLSPGKRRAAWDLAVSRSVILLAFSPLWTGHRHPVRWPLQPLTIV